MGKGGSGIEKGRRLQCRKTRRRTAVRLVRAGWGRRARVSEMQAKLHRWAVADPGRRFDDLFNFVHDPATLIVAFDRVAGNRGASTPGVDGLTVADIEEQVGRPGVPGRPAGRRQGRLVPAAAGAGTQDPQAGRVGEGPQARHSDGRGPGRPGGAEAGAGTDLRGRLRAGLLRVPAQAAGPRRDRRDPPLRHPRLPLGAGRGHRGVFRLHRPHGPDGPGAADGSRTNASWRWSRRSSRPGSSPSSATSGHPHRHAARRHPVPAAGQHRAVRAR